MAIHKEKYGILTYIFTLLIFAAMEAQAKYLAETFSVTQIVWARYIFHFIIVIIIIISLEVLGFKTGIKKPKLLKVQILRSLSLLLMTYCFFTCLSKLPIVEATIISFTSPLITVLLSPFLLKEKVTYSLLLAVGVGFIGMFIAVSPNGQFFDLIKYNDWFIGVLFGIASGLFYSLYQIGTRVLAPVESNMTSLIFASLAGVIFTSVLIIINFDPASNGIAWKTPLISEWLLLISVGVFGVIGQLLILLAYSKARAVTLAPISYVHIIWASIFGYVIFNSTPNIQSLFGALIIILAGIYTYKKQV